MMRHWPLLAVVFVHALGCCAFSKNQPESTIEPGKKVIIFDGQITPSEILQRQKELSHRPINGLVGYLSLTDVDYSPDVFWSDQNIPQQAFTTDMNAADQAKSGSKLEVFIRLNVVPGNVDWFDDKAWDAITAKFVNAAKVARAAGWPGIILDTEQYQYKPFAYWSHPLAAEKSFSQYQDQARNRGIQLAQAVKLFFADVKIFITFGYWALAEELYQGLSREKAGFALLPDFLDGLMAGNEKLTIIDGYEKSYGYRTYSQFINAAKEIRDCRSFSSDPNRYDKQLKVGFGLWIANALTWDLENFQNNYFTPEEFEHALHYALKVSDEYVWIYTGAVSHFWQNEFPKAYWDAIRNARDVHPLDFVARTQEQQSPPQKSEPPQDVKISAKGRADYSDEYVFSRLWTKYKLIADLPKQGWKFKEDPNQVGLEQKWYALELDDSKWGDIEIGDWWEAFDYLYTGYAWYRKNWTVPAEAIGNPKLLLAFGAVDEDCWIYIDGKFVDSFTHGGSGWNTPFEIDVTNHITPGKTHLIAVRVVDTAGPGGIWKSVKLIAPK
ncbi:MAG: sugar-binding domain-containing protein [Planctomycetota bacterium]